MPRSQRYDSIGVGYTAFRHPDPRISAQIWAAVGDAARVINVGAGTGSYEQPDRLLVAVEPSAVMVGQRDGTHPVVRAVAEELPFPDNSFDVALALLTVHHWNDVRKGLNELRRVARRQVIFTYDPDVHGALWVFDEYVPTALADDGQAPVDLVVEVLAADRVEIIPTPADCTDGFGSAYWRRPECYLDPSVRASISALARHDQGVVDEGMARLGRDLADGTWHRRHADLLEKDAIDGGLRLVVAGSSKGRGEAG
jgi:SAM-dependent methyltransferase